MNKELEWPSLTENDVEVAMSGVPELESPATSNPNPLPLEFLYPASAQTTFGQPSPQYNGLRAGSN